MPKATSSHFTPARTGAELHNERKVRLGYVRQDLTHLNQMFKYDGFTTVARARAAVDRRYRPEHEGRKLPSNATPIQETVVVISPETTMEQLKDLAEKIHQTWGYKPLAIYTHVDEGYKNRREWTPNLHAHMIFDAADAAGERLMPLSESLRQRQRNKWEKTEAARAAKENRAPRTFIEPAAWSAPPFEYLQDLTAQALHMDRGKKSGKKHLDAITYKIQQQEKRHESLALDNYREEKKLRKVKSEAQAIDFGNRVKRAIAATAGHIADGIAHVMGVSRQDDKIKELTAQVEKQGQQLKAAEKTAQEVQEAAEKKLKQNIAQRIYRAMGGSYVSNPVLDNAIHEVQQQAEKKDRYLNRIEELEQEQRKGQRQNYNQEQRYNR